MIGGEAEVSGRSRRVSILPVNVRENLLKSAAMRSDVEGSYEELEKDLLEYLAMIDKQNRKAIENLNSVADSRNTTTKRSQYTSTQSLGGMTRTKDGCAL